MVFRNLGVPTQATLYFLSARRLQLYKLLVQLRLLLRRANNNFIIAVFYE